MPDPTGQTQKQKSFTDALSNAWYLSDADKQFWLNNAELFPEPLLDAITADIKSENDLIKKYMLAAIKDDPTLLTEFKNKIKQIKKDAIAAEEQKKAPSADEDLEKQLQGL